MATTADTFRTLTLVELICANRGISSAELADRLQVSDRQVKRSIAWAKELGADIRPTRGAATDGGYGWVCYNKLAIRPRLDAWLSLERAQTLLGGLPEWM